MDLSKQLFWDTDISRLDAEKHARFIIERVLTSGFLTDWKTILRYYGYEKIKKEALLMRSLDKLTLYFCSSFFKIPKEEFRCYKQTQSIQEPWMY